MRLSCIPSVQGCIHCRQWQMMDHACMIRAMWMNNYYSVFV
jgi:hypothetical protein